MDEETSLVLKKRKGKYRRNTGLLLSAMGCACDSSSAFSSITRNIVRVDLANENYNNPNRLLFISSDDESIYERRKENRQAIEASTKLRDHDAKHEGMLSRVTKLVPIPKDDDDEVGDYLRFIHRRYNRFHDEIDEVGEGSTPTLNSPEIGSVGWTWDWLFSSSNPIEKTAQQQQEDALYVLGLADIASKHAKVRNKNVFDPESKLSVITPLPPADISSDKQYDISLNGPFNTRRLLAKQRQQFVSFMRKIYFAVATRCLAMSRRSIKLTLAKARKTTLIFHNIAMILFRLLMKTRQLENN